MNEQEYVRLLREALETRDYDLVLRALLESVRRGTGMGSDFHRLAVTSPDATLMKVMTENRVSRMQSALWPYFVHNVITSSRYGDHLLGLGSGLGEAASLEMINSFSKLVEAGVFISPTITSRGFTLFIRADGGAPLVGFNPPNLEHLQEKLSGDGEGSIIRTIDRWIINHIPAFLNSRGGHWVATTGTEPHIHYFRYDLDRTRGAEHVFMTFGDRPLGLTTSFTWNETG